MIKLRDYQENAIKGLQEKMKQQKKKLILCAPTGAGKTVVFSYMAKSAVDRGKRTLIVSNRIEILNQSGGALKRHNLFPIEIKSGRNLKSLNGILYVGMAQTLKRRLKKVEYQKFISDLDLIIFDEAHHQDFNEIMNFISDKTYVVGATATPHRESNQTSLDEFYQDIVNPVSISDLIDLKFLSKPNSYGVKVDLSGVKTKGGEYDSKTMGEKYDEIKLYHGVYENYMKISPNKKALIFAPSVEASKTLVEDFKSKGLSIEHLDANTPAKERKEILEWFDSTPNAMISNVGILTAGFDCPSIEVVILYRATKSLPLFLQMIGRGSRRTDHKDEFTILDFGNNIKRHGFWEQDRKWGLKKKPKKKEGEAPVKDCPSCMALLPVSIMTCPYCEHVFQKTEKEEEENIIAELEKMSYKQIQAEIRTADFKKLHLIKEAKGYKNGWIYHQLKTEEALIDYAKWAGHKLGWVQYQLKLRENEIRRKNSTGNFNFLQE